MRKSYHSRHSGPRSAAENNLAIAVLAAVLLLLAVGAYIS